MIAAGRGGTALLRLAVLLLLAGHTALGVVPALRTIRNDFANYYVAARVVREGGGLDRVYERDWFQAQVRRAGIDGLGSFVPQPPPAALLLLPFAGAAPLTAKAAWTVILVLALGVSFLVLRAWLPLAPWLLALIVLLPTAALDNALMYGQPYPLLLLLLCLSLRALSEERPLLAGFLLAPALVLKLYGVPFALYLAWTRRWRAFFGCVAGAGLALVASVAISGPAVHRTYVREVLPASLAGRIQDPYSTVWGSASSLANRLFQREPDLNPVPVLDRPALARALARGVPVAIVLAALLAATPHRSRLRREWAAVGLASLAASPLTASYHFVLLVLPVALLAAEAVPAPQGRRDREQAGTPGSGHRLYLALLLAGLCFAASAAPHFFAVSPRGWGNLIAYPRLAVVVALLAAALRPILSKGGLALALAGGFVAGLTAIPGGGEPGWTRVDEARGYLAAEPVACAGGLAWVTIASDRLVVRGPDGRVHRGPGDLFDPRCVEGALRWAAAPAAASSPFATAEAADTDARGTVAVVADRTARELRETVGGIAGRTLFRGEVRRPRLSPDAAWVVFECWENGSWNVRAVERATGRGVSVTSDPANEMEPEWLPGGGGIVFASDRRRGLGSTALYSVAFTP